MGHLDGEIQYLKSRIICIASQKKLYFFNIPWVVFDVNKNILCNGNQKSSIDANFAYI